MSTYVEDVEDASRHFISPHMNSPICYEQSFKAWHETIQQTPFFLNHGRSPEPPLGIVMPLRPLHDNPAYCMFAERLQQLVAKARKFTLAAQQRHKHYYDAKHVPAVFAVNDEVLLSTSGLNLEIAGTDKLTPCFVGPLRL